MNLMCHPESACRRESYGADNLHLLGHVHVPRLLRKVAWFPLLAINDVCIIVDLRTVFSQHPFVGQSVLNSHHNTCIMIIEILLEYILHIFKTTVNE